MAIITLPDGRDIRIKEQGINVYFGDTPFGAITIDELPEILLYFDGLMGEMIYKPEKNHA